MNKLLIHMMNAGDVDHRILPGLPKMQKAGQVKFRMPKATLTDSNIPSNATSISTNVKSGSKRNTSSLYTPAQINQIQTENDIQAARDRQGYISQAEPAQSTASKVWNVMTHPMTALQYKMPYWSTGRKAPDLPDHFERGPRNSLEIASDIVNPFFYVNEAKEFGKGAADIAYKGVTDPSSLSAMDFLNTGMHALGAVPFVAEGVQGVNFLKPGLQGFNKAYNATSGITNQGTRLRNALNAGSLRLGYYPGDVTGHSYFNMHPDEVRRLMSVELSNLPKGAYTVDGSMSKNSAPLFWSQAARNKPGFTLVNTGETQGLNWSGNMGKRLRDALPENIENIFPQAAELKEALENRIHYLRKLNDPKSLARAAQLERDGITSQIITDLPDVAQGDPRLKNALSEFLENYKPTLDKPIIDVNKNTGLDFPMTKIGKESIGNSSYDLYTQPTGYLVKGDPLFDRAPKLLGDYIKNRTSGFYFGNKNQNPRLPFIQANTIYNLGKDIYNNTQYEMGGQPCYECGGSVKKYDMGGYYDCPDQEKDPETGKCKAEVVRGRQAAAANKAATADMNAWAKQVASMDKEIAKQNAAQTAGQLTWDYDWTQAAVEKPERKAALLSQQQFFQQNPNVFVTDDTSGYTPQQKYVVASKLKQRMSTPVGSKFFQQKFGVDPRFYDLQRIQSEMAPKMGGWNGMRNWLFNVYKEEGGEYDLPQAQFGLSGFLNPVDMGMMAAKVMNFFGMNKPKIVRTPASAPKRLSIRDPRKVMMTTGQPLRPNSDLVSGQYDSEDLGNLINEAKRQDMSYNDIMNLAAMGFQESKWNRDGDKNIGHTIGGFGGHDQYSDFVGAYNAKMAEANRLKIKDEATRLQVYNGLGRIFPSTEKKYHGFNMKKIYGVPVPKGGISMRQNPLYGKQIIDLRDNVLKQSPDFMRYIDSVYKAPIPEEFANGGPIVDPRGQWAHPGKVTRIPSSNITMEGVPYPVLGIGNNGEKQVMYPGKNYTFGGASYVDEYPMMENGGGLLSQTVSCSNCGWSWNAADGGSDPMTCHKCGGMVKMKGGGYVVTRSNDRKGKTHKVTGPDGTVKYFGDSKLGQHPKDPQRKAAFYARHKKNLQGNPFFRAFARKTWEEGGEINDDKEMLTGVADILRRVKDTDNRKELAQYMMNNFREEDVSFKPSEFLQSANVYQQGGEANLWNMIKMAQGGQMIRRADGSYSRRGLWDNIRANAGSGKKPTKQMLEQERKIKAKNK